MIEADFPNSSSISKIKFDHFSRILNVTFKTGKTYAYLGVPADLVDKMLEIKEAGDSAGKFFHKNIRSEFAVILVE